MHPRNLHLYFFSPTGGTQHVAGLFAENLNAADACTDITVRAEAKTFSADDCLLVFFPVYHACKYMGFAPNKNETQRRKKIMEKYESLL